MKRSNVNVIIDNAINSQDYYRMYSSRDFYRGTSFKMAGAWTLDTHYFNDEHIIDFISCEGALLYCLRGHLSSDGRLLFSYDEPILFNASQILLPAGGVLEFKFVPSSIVNNYYVGTIWVENTSDFELKTWKQNGTLRSDLYYKSYDDYNSDSFLACGEVYFNSSGVPSLSSFSRCRTDLVLTVSQSGNFSANLDLTSIYNGRTLSISTIAFSQPIWDGAMLKMFYGSARGRINGAFLDIRTADGKVPTTSISVPFLILGSK